MRNLHSEPEDEQETNHPLTSTIETALEESLKQIRFGGSQLEITEQLALASYLRGCYNQWQKQLGKRNSFHRPKPKYYNPPQGFTQVEGDPYAD